MSTPPGPPYPPPQPPTGQPDDRPTDESPPADPSLPPADASSGRPNDQQAPWQPAPNAQQSPPRVHPMPPQQSPQGWAQPPSAPQYPPYLPTTTAPAGQHQPGTVPGYSGAEPGEAYQAPTGSSGWEFQPSQKEQGRTASPMPVLISLVVAGLVALSYAGWAFTARRGIFADFSSRRAVTSDEAASSDRIDTAWLIVAGVIAAIGLVLWMITVARRRSKLGGAGIVSAALALVGVAIVCIGLVMSNQITGATGTVAQGDRGVTATTVIGGGFVALALGLLLAAVSVLSGRESPTSPTQSQPPWASQSPW